MMRVKDFTKTDRDAQVAVGAGVAPDGHAYVFPAAYQDPGASESVIMAHNFATDADATYSYDVSNLKTAQLEIICAGMVGAPINATLTYFYALTAAGPTAAQGAAATTINSASFSTLVDLGTLKGGLLKIVVAKVAATGGVCTVRISGRS
jgi:hypothetical protein